MSAPSIWQQRHDHSGADLFYIRGAEDGSATVHAPGGGVVHTAPDYSQAHRWASNAFQLTSTQMLPYYAEYAAAWEATHPPEEPPAAQPVSLEPVPLVGDLPNKFRKPGK